MKREEYLREREISLKKDEKFQRMVAASVRREENELYLMAKHRLLPDFLTLHQIAILSGNIPSVFERIIEQSDIEIEEREIEYQGYFCKSKGATKTAYKRHLQNHGQWPGDNLLANWWTADHDEKPWLVPDDRDPPTSMDWQIAARYFYRQHKQSTNKPDKAGAIKLVHADLKQKGLFKRGGKEPPSEAAIDRLLQNIKL